MYQTLDNLEKGVNNIETPNKRKKIKKWVIIILWLVFSFWLLLFLSLCLLYKIKPQHPVSLKWVYLFLFFVPLFVEFICIYIIIWIKSKNKSKKILKNLLIMLPLFFVIVWIILTKAFVIPDYFEINCLWNKKIIDEWCTDCKCAVLHTNIITDSPWKNSKETIDWKVCCKWTYTYNILHWAN